MTTEQNQDQCSNPDCRVQETGRCIEGLSLNECEHYGKKRASGEDGVNDDAVLESNDIETSTSVPESVQLPSADYMDVIDASAVLRKGASRVLAIIGPSEAGKTTLIASTYELFLEDHRFGVAFANSLTLHAFERACHDAREASRRAVPHSERTKHGRVQFYHLEVALSPEILISLLLADRAGEEYREAADNYEILNNFQEITHADSLTLLIDGERLIDPRTRHSLRSEMILILQAFLDSGVITDRVPLAVVLTKLDVIRSNDDDESEAFFRSITDKLRDLFGEYFSEVTPFSVAASPKSAVVERGYGVQELLDFWINSSKSRVFPEVTKRIDETPDRAFLKLRELE